MRKLVNRVAVRLIGPREGALGVLLSGHRGYVGAYWDELGRLQFDFLVGEGLRPEHVLLDVGCGALRGGVHFISYLEPGNYLGLDKERRLIDIGIEKELGHGLYEAKKPEFVVSDSFEFERFSKKPHYSLAQSLYTHLAPEHVSVCLRKLRDFVEPGHRHYGTFLEGDSAANPPESHARKTFRYSRAEMEAFGTEAGWDVEYIGDWNHPRGQKMVRYSQ